MKTFEIIFECPDGNYAAALPALLRDHLPGMVDDTTEEYGIYLATATAGVNESVEFWKNTLRQTPAFVNPANFPYTLSNAPASCIAKVFGVKGPVYTFVGRKDAISACIASAEADISLNTVKHAMIVAFDRLDHNIQLNGLIMKEPGEQEVAEVHKWLRQVSDNYPAEVLRSVIAKMNVGLSSLNSV